jgi:predicted acylesterase/phospholipase RssA
MLHAVDDLSKYRYDVVSGVSAGTINGAAFATFAPGDEIEAA